jgi:LmbE family N-acetylglucosaminyl deacetylase
MQINPSFSAASAILPGEMRAVLVAAHPDDETVGASSLLGGLRKSTFIYVTDGAPADMKDARTAGFSTRQAYAAARRQELNAALRLADISPLHVHCLDVRDQEAAFNLSIVTLKLAQLFRVLRPNLVVTHAYEGGHPDHDSTAFVVHAARALLRHERGYPPVIVEMTSYHNQGGAPVFGEFLPNGRGPDTVVELDEQARAQKEALLACFATQQGILQAVPTERERFRLAPDYDFSAPPHPGPLLYELFPWGMDGARWRELAHSALQELGLPMLETASS